MRVKLLVLVAGLCVQAGAVAEPGSSAASAPAAGSLETLKQKFSYALGYQVGREYQLKDLEIDMRAFREALEDFRAGRPSRLTRDEAFRVTADYRQQGHVEHLSQAHRNARAGMEFMAANRARPGVVELPTGIQYRVIRAGTGARPQPYSTVEVHYVGKHVDGSEFDSSRRRGEPIRATLNQVIQGWTLILPMMQEGALWEVVVPPALAYGPAGAEPVIGPEETLVFEMELLKVE